MKAALISTSIGVCRAGPRAAKDKVDQWERAPFERALRRRRTA